MSTVWGIISESYIQMFDIIAVAILLYYLFVYVRGTKTAMVIQGIVVLSLVYFLCQQFRMITLVWILEKVLVVGPLALVIIFAPEIRQVLERAGKTSRMLDRLVPRGVEEEHKSSIIEVIADTAFDLAQARVGALFVITGNEQIDGYIVPGTDLQAIASQRFLASLFNKHNPLHDGAVIIEGDRIQSAGTFLPISENTYLPKFLGTRHRAAVGLTEKCDAAVIVVSEERGDVSIAYHGRLARDLNPEQFSEQINALVEPNVNFSTIVPRTVAV